MNDVIGTSRTSGHTSMHNDSANSGKLARRRLIIVVAVVGGLLALLVGFNVFKGS